MILKLVIELSQEEIYQILDASDTSCTFFDNFSNPEGISAEINFFIVKKERLSLETAKNVIYNYLIENNIVTDEFKIENSEFKATAIIQDNQTNKANVTWSIFKEKENRVLS